MRENKFISLIKVSGEVAITREKFYNLMYSIKDNYVENNQISTRFVDLIPYAGEIIVYEDRNSELDNPFVVFRMFTGESISLYIPRYHKIIWGILNEFMNPNEMKK